MNTAFQRQTPRMLNEEHETSIALLGRIERAFAQLRPGQAPVIDAPLRGLLADLDAHLSGDVGHHFDFEESSIFPLLEDAGEGDIAGLLREEHQSIRSVAREIEALLAAGIGQRLDTEGWIRLSRLVQEMVERQVDHIQKETVGLLPMLEDLLDDERDRELAFRHAAG